AEACRAHGHTALELWAEHGREAFYTRCGFTPVLAFETLLAFARGEPGSALPEATTWDPPVAMIELHGWLREAWERTPFDQRASFRSDELALAHLAREGRSFAIHRTLLAPDVADAVPDVLACFDRLLQRLPAPAPVLAIALDRVSSITAALREHGWSVAQRGTVMSLRLTP
ncbi:MAG: hypothetical protein IAG13_38015, partial [Deltaproteobacteria bacterium]|nr:hypothetical protein [Nannocystaceae bacterium]